MHTGVPVPYNRDTNAEYVNCLISNNTGAIGVRFSNTSGATAMLINTTIVGHIGQVVFPDEGGVILKNSIVWDNVAGVFSAKNSLIRGKSDTSNGNIDATELIAADIFTDPGAGDYTLNPCSPAINKGDLTLVTVGTTTDLAGNARVQLGAVDMGAFEAASNITDHSAALATEAKSVTVTLNTNATQVFANDCASLVATLYNGGSYTVAGTVTARVWVDEVPPTQYVRRHYEITPLNDAETASGRVTLYFTQEEFDAFNLKNTAKLPTGPTDTEGIARILIEKRGGESKDESGLPGSYIGAVTTIPSEELEVVWNAGRSRWEVSFEVTGFSGFFVKTIEDALPVRWISFDAQLNEQKQAVLDWKVDQVGVIQYHIERSRNAKDFRIVGTIQATGDGLAQYRFIDPIPTTGTVYYRLQETSIGGTSPYSRIVSVKGLQDATLTAYPNPVSDRVKIQLGAEYVGTRVVLVNLSGIRLQELTVNEELVSLSMKQYPAGIYLLHTFDGQIIRIFKN
jgi:hypothetical protein